MRTKKQIDREFWGSAFLLFFVCTLILVLRGSSSWFDNFRNNLVQNNIASYRLVTMVSPEAAHDRFFIVELKRFAEFLESFSGTEPIKTRIECWMTAECSDDIIRSFQNEFPGLKNIHYIPIKNILDQVAMYDFPKELALFPSHPVTQNLLKLWTLDGPFELNVYLDPKLWGRYGMQKDTLTSDMAFGSAAKNQENHYSFFMHFIFPPIDKNDPRIMLVNTDLMIGLKGSSQLRTLKKMIAHQFKEKSAAILEMVSRSDWLSDPQLTIEGYLERLEHRKSWYQENRDCPIEDPYWISQLSGGLLVSEAFNWGLCHGYNVLGADLSLSNTDRFTRDFSTYRYLSQYYRHDPDRLNQALEAAIIQNDLNLWPQNKSQFLKERLQDFLSQYNELY